MCRGIKQLWNTEISATEEEIYAAFNQAVEEVTQVTQRLLDHLSTHCHMNFALAGESRIMI